MGTIFQAQNRFKVPMGTKFYRVRCKPWTHPSLTASTMQSPQRSQLKSTSKDKEDLPERTGQTHTIGQSDERLQQTDQSESRSTGIDQSDERFKKTSQSDNTASVTEQEASAQLMLDPEKTGKDTDSNSTCSGTEL